jgi:hypothetical protein
MAEHWAQQMHISLKAILATSDRTPLSQIFHPIRCRGPISAFSFPRAFGGKSVQLTDAYGDMDEPWIHSLCGMTRAIDVVCAERARQAPTEQTDQPCPGLVCQLAKEER